MNSNQVKSAVAEKPLVHEPNAPGRNTLNNKGFAFYKARPSSAGMVVEVVRKGTSENGNSRIRSALNSNGRHYLVPTAKLSGYVYVG